MKKNNLKSCFCVLLLTILSLSAIAQKKCEFVQYYGELVSATKMKVPNLAYISLKINKIDSTLCFATLFNEHERYLNYLLSQFTDKDLENSLLKIEDKEKLQKAYTKALQNDTLFNKTMKDWVTKTVDKTTPKDTFSFEEILNIAVKFFAVTKIARNGYEGKICIGFNEVATTETVRKPLLEAFCIASIFKSVKAKGLNVGGEFARSLQKLRKISFGINEQDRLLRAQGAMFMMMYNNEILSQVLRKEYDNQKDFLPFLLKD